MFPEVWAWRELLFLGFKRRRTSGEENRLAVPKRARNLARNCARKTVFRGAEFCAKFGAKLARKIWAYDLQYRKISHQFPACLVPKISRPFLNLLSWFFSPAHPGLSYHRLFPFFMGRNKTSQRIGARSATKLQHNLRWDKENVLERKMPQGLVLVKWLWAKQSKGAEIEGVWIFKTKFPANFSLHSRIARQPLRTKCHEFWKWGRAKYPRCIGVLCM